jgi:hypothetical protein
MIADLDPWSGALNELRKVDDLFDEHFSRGAPLCSGERVSTVRLVPPPVNSSC